MDGQPITLLLQAARKGEDGATESLFRAVYSELKSLARSNRRRWRGNETMNTTALIHEAFVRLAGSNDAGFENRTHFYATASKAMRQILVNYAQKQRAQKRGGDALVVTFDETMLATETTAEEVLEIDQLLSALQAVNERRADIIECRVFGGMTVEEVAEALDISTATVKREWKVGIASLYRLLREGDDTEPGSSTT